MYGSMGQFFKVLYLFFSVANKSEERKGIKMDENSLKTVERRRKNCKA